jgi:hypothetical protein
MILCGSSTPGHRAPGVEWGEEVGVLAEAFYAALPEHTKFILVLMMDRPGERLALTARHAPDADGLGVRWMTHFVPFHRSVVLKPTAVHALADVQDAAGNSMPGAVAWVAHFLPFQRSASAPAFDPMAMHCTSTCSAADLDTVQVGPCPPLPNN